MNWDDLKVLLALDRDRSVSRAAAKLGLNPTTVTRRLKRLEESLGGRLFLDDGKQRTLTSLGKQTVDEARSIQSRIQTINLLAHNENDLLFGSVRVSATYPVARHFAVAEMSSFRSHHPNICLDLSVANDTVDLTDAQAEIALRMYRPKAGPFVIRKIGLLSHSVYRSARHNKVRSWIGYSSALEDVADVRMLEASIAPGAIVTRTNDLEVMKAMVVDGVGIAVLPDCIAADDPRMKKIKRIKTPLTIWLVMKNDVADVPIVRATADWISQCFARSEVI